MSVLPIVIAYLLGAAPIKFQRHLIDNFPAGYQVAVADLNGDGRPDVIALSTEADRVDWYENPGWQRHPVARTAKNIDLAVRDLDHNGRPVIALASGFYFNESSRGGKIQILRQPAKANDLWERAPIALDPVVHRLRWGDLEGNGRPVLVHAPIFGPGSQDAQAPKPAHLWAFRPPRRPEQTWDVWKIDESLTVLHGIQVTDLDGDGRDEILTASFEGIHRFDFKGQGPAAHWRKVQLARGAAPVNDKPGTARGSSEVAAFRLAKGRLMLAAIEPWHGNQVVVYSPPEGEGLWHRHVIDETLQEGHALVTGDFDGDGMDEIVAGWRAGGGGLRLYKATDATGREFKSYDLDPGMPAECAVAADINGDGKLDLVVIGGRKNQLVWYENLTGNPIDRRQPSRIGRESADRPSPESAVRVCFKVRQRGITPGPTTTPDGKITVKAERLTARLHDAAAGKLVGPPLEHRQRRPGMQIATWAFSPDGKLVATASGERRNLDDTVGEVRVWEVPSGKLVAEVTDAMADLGYVHAVAFSKDSSTVLVDCEEISGK